MERERRPSVDMAQSNNSKEQLKRAIDTKINTTMIGSLSRFEKLFGYLWGDRRPVSELNQEEAEFREDWELVRSQILDNGNDQKRAAFQEIDQYTVKWNKFKTDFIIRRDN